MSDPELLSSSRKSCSKTPLSACWACCLLLPRLLPAVASRWHRFCSPCRAAPEVGALSAIAKEPPERARLPPHPHSRIANCFHGLSCKLQDLGSFIQCLYCSRKVRYSVWKSLLFEVCQICFSCPKHRDVHPHIWEYAQSTYFYYQHALDR